MGKEIESELNKIDREIKILLYSDEMSRSGAREIRKSLDNIRKLLNQNKDDE
tara:strand:+ start:2937 stop:3092 length:156 start_codon:yes stop_codon:yes gene_type:complete